MTKKDKRLPATADRRLIEHYLPIEAISAEARREKSVRKGHISTLHLWWARRPLVAARAAVFGALVPQDAATPEFVAELCTYPGPKDTIAKAQQLILSAHAERLSAERGAKVTVEDIEAGRAPRPKVLDMFAGGGAIPLEALRLGCEAYALDLNPVAHLIELCTLVYPQKYGQPDPAAKGSAKDGSWAGLAAEVEHWGKWVLERVKAEIGDLYPPIPDPRAKAESHQSSADSHQQLHMGGDLTPADTHKSNLLTPVAYLWTRTVRCKNPACGGTVPLARQTWLAKKKDRFVALKPTHNPSTQPPSPLPTGGGKGVAERSEAGGRGEVEKRVRYRVVEAPTEAGLGFDPEAGSKGGNVACPFCGTVADSGYVKTEGKARRIGQQPIAVVCTQPGVSGKVYVSADDLHRSLLPNNAAIKTRIEKLSAETGLTVPDESIVTDSKGSAWCIQYGLERFGDLFTSRQQLALLVFAKECKNACSTIREQSYSEDRVVTITTYLGILTDRLADYSSTLCTWENYGELIGHTFTRQALPMVWDFAETNLLGNASGNALSALNWITDVIKNNSDIKCVGQVLRGSAIQPPFEDGFFDAIVTDPPYYDNVAYADLSDYFHVWLKRSIGYLYPEHFSLSLTPKKGEAVADATRHNGDRGEAAKVYEQMMGQTFKEASRILKPHAPLVIVYAHKTTLGWSTLVDALRIAGFTVTEAWPLDTERAARLRAIETASLASSIFLVARRREGNETGAYEAVVQPELETIVRERVETLWAKGITGADLVIACVGAGLRAFTRFARVEYANGEEVPADRFLGEVEGVVLDTLLEKLFGVPRAGVSAVDAPTRFYVLWR
ncbi:MAG: DUF1156 domain-containing protein, partial [Chloroflexi bacterium]|nr:DUF1156 domain-containing protein [Chloroflexota bacterium]